jgi:hypothetical protein
VGTERLWLVDIVNFIFDPLVGIGFVQDIAVRIEHC